ncbi:MAG: hypothetical protein B0D92_01160 [Spirochaeta sp. LUC14_002_19_P3]|nr:MAG: hypothetical protein B0D92_01160 [Spirochaeta sp. LUC14_002_19_P3]
MKIYTTDTIVGKEITASLGIVCGSMVQSKHLGRDFMAGLKTLVGGEIKGYTEMLSDARQKAVDRMLEDARRLNADAVVGVRFTTSSIAQGMSEVLAFGTAVNIAR